jgi:chemotaxis protein methyltransferase CheR
MPFPRPPIMLPEEFRLIREFVTEVFGLVLDDNKEGYLAAKLQPRLEELRLSSFTDYYAYLKFSPGNTEEQQRLISLITNNETYFFREEAQLRILTNEVLPPLKEKKIRVGERRLRIVSAGCSSGEEVYSLAMTVLETGNFLWDWDVQIIGVDIDPHIIARARSGIYAGRSLQATPPRYLDRYFRKCADGFMVREVVANLTRFVEGNLLHLDRYLERQQVDVIFCRNVLIYFDDDSIRRSVEGFAEVLVPEGYLFLGHSESLSRITTRYAPVRYPGSIIYRKRS